MTFFEWHNRKTLIVKMMFFFNDLVIIFVIEMNDEIVPLIMWKRTCQPWFEIILLTEQYKNYSTEINLKV